jgi:cathepsin L/cathepsin K
MVKIEKNNKILNIFIFLIKMKSIKYLVILLASLVCLIASISCNSTEDVIIEKFMEAGEIRELFKVWHLIYKKGVYTMNSDEYTIRLEIFKSKVDEIKKWNMDPSKTWKKGLNKFSDLTKSEFRENYLTNMDEFLNPLGGADYSPTNGLINYDYYVEKNSVYSFKAIDWSVHSGPVDDQGVCGSCYAFASLNAIESSYFIKTGQRVKLSRQQVVDCSTKNKGCNGGWPSFVAVYARANGLMLESDYPYKQQVGTCLYNASKAKNYISGFIGHNQSQMTYILKKYSASYLYELLKKGPVAVAIDGDALGDYKSGVWSTEGCFALNHAVLLVGFGFDEYGTPYWIIKNSWGTNFGEKGFFRFTAKETDSAGNCFLYYYPYRPFFDPTYK